MPRQLSRAQVATRLARLEEVLQREGMVHGDGNGDGKEWSDVHDDANGAGAGAGARGRDSRRQVKEGRAPLVAGAGNGRRRQRNAAREDVQEGRLREGNEKKGKSPRERAYREGTPVVGNEAFL
jgi:hypothetical protein